MRMVFNRFRNASGNEIMQDLTELFPCGMGFTASFLPQDDLGSAVEFLGYVARPLGDRQLSQSSARAKVTSEEELVTVAGQVTTGSEKLDPCGGFP